MSKLNKSKNGLIFYDDFKERTLLWTLSPSDANNLRFGENGLTMLHHRKYTIFTMTEPEAEEYSCIVELDHIPWNFDDIGGIIILANNREYAECQSFLATAPSEFGNSVLIQADIREMIKIILNDSYVQYTINDEELPDLPSPSESSTESSEGEATGEETEEKPFIDTFYKFIKFTKQKYKYIFWASEDSIHWFEVGNVSFNDSGVIGFFLYGTEDQEIIEHSHFNVKSIGLYSSRYLIFDAIPKEYDFEIIGGDGQYLLRTDSISYAHMVIRSNNRCLVNTTTLPMPLKNARLRIYPRRKYDETVAIHDLGETTYGGDVFTLEHDIKAFIDNVEISPTELFDLGVFARGNHKITMTIQNCENYAIENIKLHVTAYSEYYAGSEEVSLALPPNSNTLDESLQYYKSVVIDKMEAGAFQPVYIKLTDEMIDMLYRAANIYRFKITIE